MKRPGGLGPAGCSWRLGAVLRMMICCMIVHRLVVTQ